jgi:NAD(P)H-hydrate repair Nnr-like enzyme with NAD(P)H-hydrate dehydratase domain
VTVLKGARTVIAAPDGSAYINLTGNQNLATGGTGDVLGGMIAGFIAQGLSPLNASVVAVHLHGLAADLYTEQNDPYSLTASALINHIPSALRELLR